VPGIPGASPLAPEWKHEIFRTTAHATSKNTVIGSIMKNEKMPKRGKDATDAAKQCTTPIHRLPPACCRPARPRPDRRAGGLRLREGIPRAGVRRSDPHFEAEGRVQVKALTALPFKPSIIIE
jgi:leucyl-tRNA synthetase